MCCDFCLAWIIASSSPMHLPCQVMAELEIFHLQEEFKFPISAFFFFLSSTPHSHGKSNTQGHYNTCLIIYCFQFTVNTSYLELIVNTHHHWLCSSGGCDCGSTGDEGFPRISKTSKDTSHVEILQGRLRWKDEQTGSSTDSWFKVTLPTWLPLPLITFVVGNPKRTRSK